MRLCTTVCLTWLAASATALPGLPHSTRSAARNVVKIATRGDGAEPSIFWPWYDTPAYVYFPTTADGGNQSYQVYYDAQEWVAPDPQSSLIELQDLSDAIGLRVQDAPDTAVWIAGQGAAYPSGPLSYFTTTAWDNDQPDLAVDVASFVFATYPSVVNATGGSSAPYGPPKPAPFSMGFLFLNADCNDFNLTAVLAYENGSTSTVTGVTDDGMHFDSSPDLVNFTLAVAQYPDMNNTFYWNQSAAPSFTVAYAPGPGLPMVEARHQAEITFCPD